MYTGLHVKYPLLLSDFYETSIFSIDFRKVLNIKFHENPSSGNRVPRGGREGRTDRYDEVNSRFSQFCQNTKP